MCLAQFGVHSLSVSSISYPVDRTALSPSLCSSRRIPLFLLPSPLLSQRIRPPSAGLAVPTSSSPSMAAEGVNMMVEVPQSKPTIKSRFSTLRFRKAVKGLNPIQIGYLRNHSMAHLLNLPDHLMVPLKFLQWLVDHTSYGGTGSYFFKHKEKQIFLTKDMVDKVFGFQRGTVPFLLESSDPEAVREVESLRRQYLRGSTIPVSKVESIMLGTNDERVFLRSFILFFITTVLCPSTYNFVNPKYLYSLRDRDILLVEFRDFGTLCLEHVFEEMDNWKDRIFMNPGDYNRLSWIGGCLPVLGVVYMDFLEFNGNAGTIDYRVPKMLHIKNSDFAHVHGVDRNKMSHKAYGVLPIRDISLTPYGVPMLVHVVPQLPEIGGGVAAEGSASEAESAEMIEVSSSDEPDGWTSQNSSPPYIEQDIHTDDIGNEAEFAEPDIEGGTFSAPTVCLFSAFCACCSLNYVMFTYPCCHHFLLFFLHAIQLSQDVQGGSYDGVDDVLQPVHYSEATSHSPPDFGTSPDPIGIGIHANVPNSGSPVHASVYHSNVGVESQNNHVGAHTVEDTGFIGDGLFSIAVSYADVSPTQQAPIAEGFVSGSLREENVVDTQVNMSTARVTVCETRLSQSSLDRKNRWKRATKRNSPDHMSSLVLKPAVKHSTENSCERNFSPMQNLLFSLTLEAVLSVTIHSIVHSKSVGMLQTMLCVLKPKYSMKMLSSMH